MPISVVVGGQFGSEGKGKVALEVARAALEKEIVVVRVGGPNSGHTGYSKAGKKYALRQLPAGCIDRNVDVVFPAGSYIEVDVLLNEIQELNYPKDRIYISPFARVITKEHKDWELSAGLGSSIGSTVSGVGAAVMAAVAREAKNFPLKSVDAAHISKLDEFLCDTSNKMRDQLERGARIIIEGSQGFGLSLLDGGYWPKATSRCTSAAGALSEAGLSPLDVDDIYLVLRSFPIRVAGASSGPLPGETTWDEIARNAGIDRNLREYTTVTNNLRRVGAFDASQAKTAIDVNAPSRIVMNHMDYIGPERDLMNSSSKVSIFINEVEKSLGQKIDYFGFSPLSLLELSPTTKADL